MKQRADGLGTPADWSTWALARERRSRCAIASVLVRLYAVRSLRSAVIRTCSRLEGGAFFSETWREILLKYHGVVVGRYSYGSCMQPGILPRGSRVGNYCSFAAGVTVWRRNHPYNRLSTHPFFYEPLVGPLRNSGIEPPESNPLVFGHDVWIGYGATLLPNCRSVGDGAVIGAGTVVTKDVEPYAIVGGNPGRVLRYRFDAEIRQAIQQSEWWMQPVSQMASLFHLFLSEVTRPAIARITQATIERPSHEDQGDHAPARTAL